MDRRIRRFWDRCPCFLHVGASPVKVHNKYQSKRGFFAHLGRAVTLILVWVFAFFYLGAAANWGNWGIAVAFFGLVGVVGL
jgi:hypothetical protein